MVIVKRPRRHESPTFRDATSKSPENNHEQAFGFLIGRIKTAENYRRHKKSSLKRGRPIVIYRHNGLCTRAVFFSRDFVKLFARHTSIRPTKSSENLPTPYISVSIVCSFSPPGCRTKSVQKFVTRNAPYAATSRPIHSLSCPLFFYIAHR